ncbi:MAG: Mrp/NBP35 family ATP-binding protein [Tissierellia bacterium]|nr:Mrp/NBP35 family ATP-binding protein [Tissierellia bacterium]
MERKDVNYDSFKIKLNENSSIKHVIAVMSGKGGVGKSSVTSLIANRLNQLGYKVGIFDADITGPSIPEAFGLYENATGSKAGINPEVSRDGVKVMSVNLILSNKTDPVVWRSPVVNNVLKQFYSDVNWGELDYLLVDMPPGTSDVPLTIYQSLPVDGCVIVTSPQNLVSMIVEKSINMARMVNVDILGIVENMSYYKCPDCGSIHKIFGEGNTKQIAGKYGISTVCELPINPKIAQKIDNGQVEDLEITALDDIINNIKNLDNKAE